MARLISLRKVSITVFSQSIHFATELKLILLFGIAVCAIGTAIFSRQNAFC
jgi:cell division protein FtsL